MSKILFIIILSFFISESYSQETIINFKPDDFYIYQLLPTGPKARYLVTDSIIIINENPYTVITKNHNFNGLFRLREDGYYVSYDEFYRDSEYIYFKKDIEYGDVWINHNQTNMYPLVSTVVDTATIFWQSINNWTKVYYILETDSVLMDNYYYWSKEFGLLELRAEQYYSQIRGAYIGGVKYGDTSYYPVSVENENLPFSNYSLSQNYPNPFNPSTNIKFSLPEGGITTIKVYDILGEEKATILDEYTPSGSYSVSFKAKDLPSGVYIYTITSGSFKQSRKMLLMK
ncbi:MAG: T9SS type A sorting domain-containing protein [Syntrophothermus sp.]